jgi:preprotein translocase subunit Sec61beta
MNIERLSELGIDPYYIIIVMVLLQCLIIVLLIGSHIRYFRMRKNYASFMRGKDGLSMEAGILSKFEEVDKYINITDENTKDIKDIYRRIGSHYQKVGIVKYDAFLEMGGNLSFALTLLDQDDTGFIMNVLHSRDGCYTYIKEIIKGESYIELVEEESESLERAIFQEEYVLKTP